MTQSPEHPPSHPVPPPGPGADGPGPAPSPGGFPPPGGPPPPDEPPPGGFPPPDEPPPAWHPPAPAPRRRPLLVVTLVLAGLLLVGGGATVTWWLVRDPAVGADSPELAVQSFLRAVYREQDPIAAAELVCSQARDEASLADKVEEIRAYQETQVEPRFQWSDPAVVEQTDEVATVEITVTMITRDERVADQHLRVNVLDDGDRGWWVCDVAVVEPTGPDPEAADGVEPADDSGDAGDSGDGSGEDGSRDDDGE